MGGYSKIGFVRSSKSRSKEFSDLSYESLPPTQKPISKDTCQKSISKSNTPAEPKEQIRKPITRDEHSSLEHPQEIEKDGAKNGERFGVILSRSCSISSGSSHRFSRYDKQRSASGIPSAVKRAFSMRRSSSVSERYCRIYDQSVSLASPTDDAGEGMAMGIEKVQERSVKRQPKSGKMLNACKRLFGL